jgi:pyridoxal phosphate enzyme (YggS family)
MTVGVRIEETRRRIAAACARAGRDPSGVRLVAVTKTVGAGVFPQLLAAGVPDVGENRVQDALAKAAGAPPGLRWHLIGHLQTNKARRAVTLFRTIHSVDSLRLAAVLQEEAVRAKVDLDAFVEINSGESQKSGIPAPDAEDFLAAASAFDRLRWVGLMTMAPLAPDPEASRPFFRALRQLRDRLRARVSTLEGLSMGMTQDFEVAVEEGATHVRVGRALFEAR